MHVMRVLFGRMGLLERLPVTTWLASEAPIGRSAHSRLWGVRVTIATLFGSWNRLTFSSNEQNEKRASVKLLSHQWLVSAPTAHFGQHTLASEWGPS
jgi:hypothetical protein